jgi:hypothetical protein
MSDDRQARDADGVDEAVSDPAEPGAPAPASATPTEAQATPRRASTAFAIYTVLRLAVFAAVAAVLYAVGVRNLWFNLMLAILISGLISLIALERFRIEAGVSLERRGGLRNPFAGMKQRIEARTRAEDAADDAARAARGDPPPTRPAP